MPVTVTVLKRAPGYNSPTQYTVRDHEGVTVTLRCRDDRGPGLEVHLRDDGYFDVEITAPEGKRNGTKHVVATGGLIEGFVQIADRSMSQVLAKLDASEADRTPLPWLNGWAEWTRLVR